MTDTFEVLISCLPEGLGVRRVTPETTFVELGMDSLDFVQFIVDAEEALDVTIPNQEAKHFKTIGSVEQWLLKQKQPC